MNGAVVTVASIKERINYLWQTYPYYLQHYKSRFYLSFPVLLRDVQSSNKSSHEYFAIQHRLPSGVLSIVAQQRREKALRSRKRSLSIDHKQKRMRSQEQCMFLSKFPAEIRLKIYEEVLCTTSGIHIQSKGVDHDRMRLHSFDCGYASEVYHNAEDCVREENKRKSVLGLLLTCKRIYREAIDTLYTTPRFHFSTRKEFLIFTKSIPQCRLDKIRHLSIEGFWRLYDKRQYSIINRFQYATTPKLDRTFASMAGLRQVCLIFIRTNIDHFSQWTVPEEDDYFYDETDFPLAKCDIFMYVDMTPIAEATDVGLFCDLRPWEPLLGDRPVRELIRLR